ncbi:uncharacterized protein LOC124452272 [Xenia sp. Carnegie-2017]|uniref:uncharacterized protein LOC124452272 n=1 Tax=Xenia sp. Carnegie-2017 TaxID=2897299 RepID=UPI001F0481BA|nr:uncharacterized protein LOC124452272 [Xenia sp. Carnegie-2017]
MMCLMIWWIWWLLWLLFGQGFTMKMGWNEELEFCEEEWKNFVADKSEIDSKCNNTRTRCCVEEKKYLLERFKMFSEICPLEELAKWKEPENFTCPHKYINEKVEKYYLIRDTNFGIIQDKIPYKYVLYGGKTHFCHVVINRNRKRDTNGFFIKYVQSGKCVGNYPISANLYTMKCFEESAYFKFLQSGSINRSNTTRCLEGYGNYPVLSYGNFNGECGAINTITQTNWGGLVFSRFNKCIVYTGSNLVLRLANCKNEENQRFNFGSVTCDGKNISDVSCSNNQYMVIKVAEYRGLRNGSICGYSYDHSCSVDVTCDLKNYCDGERECNITVDDNHFHSNICPGLEKYLYFEYQCNYTIMDVRLSKSNLPNKGVVNVITKLRNFTICNKGLLHKIKTIICKQLGYPTAASGAGSMSLSSLMHQSFIPGNVKCDAQVNDLSQCAITQNNDCSQYLYVTCHVCDNPLLKNAEKFPDSWFTAFPKSRSAAKARISSGSSWCAPAANGNHYLQLNFPSLYTVNVITIFGDSSSSSFVTKYHLQTNIDDLSRKQNGYNDAAIEKFSGGLKSKALRIFPLKFVGAPCLRIEICGGGKRLTPRQTNRSHCNQICIDVPRDIMETSQKNWCKTWYKYLESSYKISIDFAEGYYDCFDKTLEVTDKKPYNITNLVPYATYKVNVTAGNSEGFGRSTTATFRTAEDVPEGPPLNVQIVALSSSSLSVTWEPPDKKKTNGKIVSYTVCITHLENETCSMKYMIEEQRLDINNVKPGTKYYVRVLASTIVGSGCYSNVTWVFTNGLAPELSTKQIGNTLTYLLQNPNLEYRYFYVVAMKNVTEESRLPSNFENTDLVTYSKAISSTQPMPYIAAVVSRRDFKPDFTLGHGENTMRRSNGENYYNGPLKPGTSYKIFQRVFINDQGDYYSTDWSPVAATAQKHKSERPITATAQSTDVGKIGAIAGAVVAAILLIIFVILVILFVRINSNSATVQ